MAASSMVTVHRTAINTMNTFAVQQQKIIQRAASEEQLKMKLIPQTTQFTGFYSSFLLNNLPFFTKFPSYTVYKILFSNPVIS
ncbi:hypothetical protein Q1W71_12075 [Flavobacterium pectinovorum]|uniref:hypothetical protein n=1 Tax=Flavobacterium pectinovorum TaxID=29533 RepID=UPI00265F544C|nr:hypothetical protein [Flavobacterium pectinovorum]WKL50482.1 hypothetical protein Q1W71_12075 [Flavobacterium pectinovorum]